MRLDNAAFGRKLLAAGEKIPVNPANPVYIKTNKIESIPHPLNSLKFHIRRRYEMASHAISEVI
jgi:hypothetical protein